MNSVIEYKKVISLKNLSNSSLLKKCQDIGIVTFEDRNTIINFLERHSYLSKINKDYNLETFNNFEIFIPKLKEIIKIKNIINNSHVLCKTQSGVILLNKDLELIIKVRYYSYDCALHEYNIMKLLKTFKINSNGLKYDVFPSNIELFNSFPSFHFMSFENYKTAFSYFSIDYKELDVSTLNDEFFQSDKINNIKELRIKEFIKQIFFTLIEISEQFEFTSYDFHFKNILVKETLNKNINIYKCFGKQYQLETNFEIRFIDFAMSHIKGVTNCYTEVAIEALISGSMPSIYDNIFDISVLFWYLPNSDDYEYKKLETIFEECGFVTHNNRNEKNSIWPGRETITFNNEVELNTIFQLIDDNRFWNGLNIANYKTLEEFSKQWIEYSIFLNPQSNEYYNLVLKFKKQFGYTMREEKLNRILKRKFNFKEIFNQFLMVLDIKE